MPHVVNTRVVSVPSLEQQRLGIDTAVGDCNSTAEHVDVIKESLRFKAESVIASDQDREQARQMLRQLYPKEFKA